MDWFKKQKLTNWVIGALIVINIATLASLWLLRPERGIAVPPVVPDHEQRVMDLLRGELRLDDRQAGEFRALRISHFTQSRELNARILFARRELMDAVLADPPDTLLVGELADRLGVLLRERELKNAYHLEHLGTICTPGQRTRLHMLMRDLLPEGDQAGPHGGLRSGTGRGYGRAQGTGRGAQNRPGPGRRSGDRGNALDTLRSH
ncbi:periplasmic heavy metal sensor [bacterium]|nr:periplasmic heavy metal sensor [bacterium]